ncbi:unnamed protein product [Dovyalis caffra]|uniref:Uncharacterized protein n=1 Tax=Dovyalis caffra TaxID=77055 RepID=A0AAV1SS90_9ROSI|nr:unnamed protein product [Dovyalis caffra]
MSKEKYSHFERFRVRKSVVGESVTKQEIAKFWRQKLIEEEDHLLDAIKAAARLRARNLSEDDNKLFEESLKDDDETDENNTTTPINSTKYGKCDEMHLGIKDR